MGNLILQVEFGGRAVWGATFNKGAEWVYSVVLTEAQAHPTTGIETSLGMELMLRKT